MKKLMIFLFKMNTTIGRNSLFISCLFFLNSCVFFDLFEDVDGISSNGYLVNSTSDTIYVTHKTIFYSSGHVTNNLIPPNDTLFYGGGGLTASSDGDALDAFFSENGENGVFVYLYDSTAMNYVSKGITYDVDNPFTPDTSTILCSWSSPLEEMGGTIHHFYNRSSWVVIPTDENHSFFDVYFTITEEDLE